MFEFDLADADATVAFGELLALHFQDVNYIALQGDLGAGKTTLVRGFLRGLGHNGKVKSPTFTLVEEYSFTEKTIYHFDLYRLNDPEELEAMGIRDYFSAESLCLIEWPEKAESLLPKADLLIKLDYQDTQRQITLFPQTETTQTLCEKLSIK